MNSSGGFVSFDSRGGTNLGVVVVLGLTGTSAVEVLGLNGK